MSLDWLDCTDLYLAQDLALFKSRHVPAQVISLAATLPWERRLAVLWERMAQHKHARRLRVVLSGSLCQAVSVQAPQGISSSTELQLLLDASAAAALSVDARHLRCCLDTRSQTIGAATGQSLMAALTTWATSHKLNLTSVQPSWAIASQCPLVRQPRIGALEVTESDGITMLTQGQNGWSATHLPVAASGDTGLAHIRRQRVSMGISPDTSLQLRFQAERGSVLPQGPTRWSGHWSVT